MRQKRYEAKEREERMSLAARNTWIIVIGSLLVVLLFSFFGYRAIHGKMWQELSDIRNRVLQETVIRTITRVDRFMGDGDTAIYTVIGQDEAKEVWIAWVEEELIHIELASSGISQMDAEQMLFVDQPQAKIIRTIPGKLGDTYIWEIFFKISENNEDHYYYQYYSFKDGKAIDRYRLGL